MNLTHYIVGFTHYFCTGTGVLCEAPGFSNVPPASTVTSSLPLVTFPLVLIFLWAWHRQLQAHQTFAELKKTNPTKHSVPHGGLFSLVSCPHYTMEIMMYTVVMLILGPQHRTGLLLWAWVTVNQVITAVMSHRWYRETFTDYPRQRKAII